MRLSSRIRRITTRSPCSLRSAPGPQSYSPEQAEVDLCNESQVISGWKYEDQVKAKRHVDRNPPM
jgi:hypothetical protein